MESKRYDSKKEFFELKINNDQISSADYNGDGKKDIGYIDSGIMPTLDPNNDLKKKTVLIRTGNKFIEQDYYQFDPYAKSILSIIIK